MSCCPSNKENRSDSTLFNYRYERLKNLTKYECEPSCLCNGIDERSDWDKIQFNWTQKNKVPHFQKMPYQFENAWTKNMK